MWVVSDQAEDPLPSVDSLFELDKDRDLRLTSGAIAVVAARGDWQTLSVGELDEEVQASPAIGDGRLYVRTRSRLYAFGPAN